MLLDADAKILSVSVLNPALWTMDATTMVGRDFLSVVDFSITAGGAPVGREGEHLPRYWRGPGQFHIPKKTAKKLAPSTVPAATRDAAQFTVYGCTSAAVRGMKACRWIVLVHPLGEPAKLAAPETETLAELPRAEPASSRWLSLLLHEALRPASTIFALAQAASDEDDEETPAGKKTSTKRKPDARADALRRIEAQADRLLGFLRGVGRMAKDGVPEVRPVRLREVVANVLEQSREILESRQTRVHLDAPAESLQVLADARLLGVAIGNLIENAADAMESLPANEREIIVSIRSADAANVELEVKDHGPGLSIETIHHLFEPQRAGKPGGLGMGLSLSRWIVESFQGQIRAASHSSGSRHGATFFITLPSYVGRL